MKKLLAVVLAAAFIGGCSASASDGSSGDEALNARIERMAAELAAMGDVMEALDTEVAALQEEVTLLKNASIGEFPSYGKATLTMENVSGEDLYNFEYQAEGELAARFVRALGKTPTAGGTYKVLASVSTAGEETVIKIDLVDPTRPAPAAEYMYEGYHLTEDFYTYHDYYFGRLIVYVPTADYTRGQDTLMAQLGYLLKEVPYNFETMGMLFFAKE